ncbi:MAG: hypothetical protein K2X47_00545 [Bdellovibrionales bacterium]|nr:hypothetical protein [Bdellovibrionales bacterium]
MTKPYLGVFWALLFLVSPTWAEVRIAFLEIKSPSGRSVILEPGGRYAHVAISIQDDWLHAHPLRGVEIISDNSLHRLGSPTILNVPWIPALTAEKVLPFLGKPFDTTFSWSNGSGYYCSELVGKILGLEPTPMTFTEDAWPAEFSDLRQSLGLSPDDIFKMLIAKLKSQPSHCSELTNGSP